MAKELSTNEAISITNKHQEILSNLENILKLKESFAKDISDAAEKYITKEVINILNGISIDELNRRKSKIRTKVLYDHHISTIGDLWGLSIYNIASIRGISQDTAYTIKRIVDDYALSVRKEVKIKLSIDSKTREASNLVKAIYLYKSTLPAAYECEDLLNEYKKEIQNALESLKIARSKIRWFFSFRNKKESALAAYKKLDDLLNSDYKVKANKIIASAKNLNRITYEMAWNDFAKDNVKYYTILEEINPAYLSGGDSVYGLPEDLARQINDECFFPDGLKCTLRRYQEWGVKYILHQEKVLLGDEMGLGKTIQAIAAMVSLKNTGATHFIVVCPASVVTNWYREITKHSKLRVTLVHGNNKKYAFKSWMQTGGVAVTTYEATSTFSLGPKFRFNLLVVDEAHYIKNPDAKRTIHTRGLAKQADRILLMTGTPLENRVDEMITLISYLRPEVANSLKGIAFMSLAPQFREKVAACYYRRKREDVLSELPELIESNEWCSMNKVEEEAYEQALLNHHFQEARRLSWNIENLNESSKAQRMKEIVEEAELENRKVLIFSFFLDTIAKVTNFLGNRCFNPITGALSPARRQEIIDEFDSAPSGSVLVAQIQSGGTGLNIQSASVVIICEPQFKPSIENQAISRAYRMGQSRNVLVYRLLCLNSLDERLTELLEHKKEIFDAFADKSVAGQQSLEIDEKTFGDIISEEIQRINQKRALIQSKN